MYVAHIMPTLDRNFGGPVNAVLNLGAVQRKLGIKVSYWATASKDTACRLADLHPDLRLFDTCWPRRWFRSPELAKKLAEEITSFDLIETHGVWEYTVFTTATTARKANIPYIIRPTGIFTHPWRYRTLKKRLYSGLIGNRALKGAACLHVASQMEAKGCYEAGLRTPVTIVPNGIDPKTFETLPNPELSDERWPILKDRQVVLFLSRISREKGLDQFIPAVRDFLDTDGPKNLLFVIAGPDHKGYLSTVKYLVESYNLKPYVFFTGAVKGEEKLALYARADLFVLPSYSENYGIVVAEALASRTPVITTTATPWDELLDVGAGYSVAPERGALAEALHDFFALSKSSRDILGQRGRKFVFERYTWENAARKLQTVYQCILDGKDIPLNPEPALMSGGII